MTPNSRSYITQFSQPDSIIPDPYNPQDWNRYAYARYNPLVYTDPTGHDPVLGFIQGFLNELNRTNAWFAPGYQEKFAIRDSETDAELTGRLVADVVSGGLGLLEAGGGTFIAGSGVAACGTGVLCLAGAPAIVGGGALIAQGAGTTLKAADGAGTILAEFSERWGSHSGQDKTVGGYDVRIDWESPGNNGNVHVTVNGEKIYITDPSDLSELPKGLQKNPWIKQQVDRAFKQLTKFEELNNR